MKSSDRSINMITPVAGEIYAEHEAAPVFVEAMAAAVSPVSIVTTNGPAGRFGLTVSAVTSVSADPPLVLACINKKSPLLSAIRTNKLFCINMLSVKARWPIVLPANRIRVRLMILVPRPGTKPSPAHRCYKMLPQVSTASWKTPRMSARISSLWGGF